MTETLARLEPKHDAPPAVDVLLDEPIPTDNQAEEAFHALGLSRVSRDRVAFMRKLGLHIKGHGVLQTVRGAIFLDQMRLSDTAEILHLMLVEGFQARKAGKTSKKEYLTVEQACAIGHTIGYVTDKRTSSLELSVKLSGEGNKMLPLPDETPSSKSFPAGAIIVGGSAQVQIHQNEKSQNQIPIAKLTEAK